MQANYLRSHFEAENIEVITPEQNDMTTIDEVRRAVYNGKESKSLIQTYHEIIEKYTQHHPVILGCTELSINKPKQKVTNNRYGQSSDRRSCMPRTNQ